MNKLLLGVCAAGTLLVPQVFAQRGGISGVGGGMPAGRGGGVGRQIPTALPWHGRGGGWRGGFNNGVFNNGGFNNGGFGFTAPIAGFLGGFGGVGGFYSDLFGPSFAEEPPAAPSVIVIAPPVPPEPPPPPPPPAQPVIRNYHWPESPQTQAQTFSLVGRDGAVHQAIAVWVQDGEMRFATPKGSMERLPLRAMDRDATQRLNTEKGLTLWLPPQRN